MEKVYFTTGGEAPSEEIRNQIKALGGKWNFQVKAWTIDQDQVNNLPLIDNAMFFRSVDDLKAGMSSNLNANAESKTQEQPKKEEKNELSPELKEALNFKNGRSDQLSPEALSAYVVNQAKFYASKYRGDKNGIADQIKKDPLFNRSLLKTKAREFEPKIPRIMQTLTAACQDAHALIPSYYEKLSKTKDPQQQRFIKRDIAKQFFKIQEKLSTFFPKLDHEQSQEKKEQKTSQASLDAEAFIQGKSTDLSLRALKSHVMKFTNQLCRQALDTNINAKIAIDPILNTDLSKTSLKDLNISLSNLKKNIADTVLKTREQIKILDEKLTKREISADQKVREAMKLTFKARLGAVATLPNRNVLEAQQKQEMQQTRDQDDRIYISLTKEQVAERSIVKKIDGHRYSSKDNVWSVPRDAALMNAELAGMRVFANHNDFMAGKEMNAQQKNMMFVKNDISNEQQQSNVNQETRSWKR